MKLICKALCGTTTWHINEAFILIEEDTYDYNDHSDKYRCYTHIKKSKIEEISFTTPRTDRQGAISLCSGKNIHTIIYSQNQENEAYAFYIELMRTLS